MTDVTNLLILFNILSIKLSIYENLTGFHLLNYFLVLFIATSHTHPHPIISTGCCLLYDERGKWGVAGVARVILDDMLRDVVFLRIPELLDFGNVFLTSWICSMFFSNPSHKPIPLLLSENTQLIAGDGRLLYASGMRKSWGITHLQALWNLDRKIIIFNLFNNVRIF